MTLATAKSILPFGNELRFVVANGSTIRSILESSVESDAPQGRFLIPYGLRFWWNPAAKPSSRVARAEVRRPANFCKASKMSLQQELRIDANSSMWQVNQFPKADAWKPLEDGKEYQMVLQDFILSGGDGYGMVPGAGVR